MNLYQHLYIHFYPEQLTEFIINRASIKRSYAQHLPIRVQLLMHTRCRVLTMIISLV